MKTELHSGNEMNTKILFRELISKTLPNMPKK